MSTIPLWLLEVKEDFTKSNEWNELTKHIYDAVDQHLSQNHVAYFTDLADSEKILLLERAARSLASSEGGNIYDNMQSKLSYILDQSVNNQVSKKLLEDKPSETKTDLVLDTTCEGIMSLLRKYPEQKYKLRIFLNQPIPQPLRFLAWQLYLSNIDYRKDFINKLASDPKSCLSPLDSEIQRKCVGLLNNAVVFKELRESEGNINSMKGLLSYYHTTMKNRSTVTEPEYLLAMPFIAANYPPLPRHEKPTERTLAILIEMYLQFMSTLPPGLNESIYNTKETKEMESMVKAVLTHLETYDSELVDFLRDLSKKTSAPGIEDITFNTALKAMSSPLMRVIFSGYLNLESLLYVWDQYMISMDIPGYRNELVPIVCAIILMLLRDQIMICRSFGDIDECIKHQSTLIQTRQIQTLVNKYFFKSLQKKMNTANALGPIIDPTVGRLQPWEHWHSDRIPNGNKQRPTMKPKEDNSGLEDKLREETNKRLRMEKELKDQIERLKRDLDNSRKNQPNEPDPRKKPASPPPKPFRGSTSKQPVIDMLEKLNVSINKIASGEGMNKRNLNEETRENLKLHKLDLKIAEKQVFGRLLRKNEWESFSEFERNLKSEQMLEIVKSRIQKRFVERAKF